ncbi:DUF86 domain-containing protein [Sulfurimonas sp.]|nr:DUF86 domain-containing protein [Sulfurimonas sp.]
MSKRDIELFVNDIYESIEAIFDYTKDMNLEEFSNDRKTYSAVIREFEIIGEATKHLPSDILDKYKDVEWRDLKDFRNLLIHEYFGVDFEIVYKVIKDDLEILRQTIHLIKKDLP